MHFVANREDGGYELSISDACGRQMWGPRSLRAVPFAAALPAGGVAGTVLSTGVSQFLSLYNAALIGRILLTWFPQAPEAISRPLATVCDPYLNLFRGIIPPLGGTLDLSPILAFVALDVITNTASAIPAEVDAQGQMVTMPAPRWKAGMNAAGRKITSLASGLSL
ncbi:CPLD8 [Auxenochlorella protothecoides x Auxenochlorella symbiontica]